MVFDTKTMLLNRKNDYEWSDGYKYGVDPNIVGSIIEEIETRDGIVTSGALLESAREEESPIHNLYEWDDQVAAEKWRLDQSRKIICNLRVVVKDEGNAEPIRLSAFVRINEGDVTSKSQYINVKDALLDDENRSIILGRMYRDMKAFSERYRIYDEAVPVLKAIEEVFDAQKN